MVNIRFISLTFFFLILLLLGGCTSTPVAEHQPAQVEDRSSPVRKPPSGKSETTNQKPVTAPVEEKAPGKEVPVEVPEEKPLQGKNNPAVVALLDNADQLAEAGQNSKAVASLERAIRIDPKNPVLWNKLGYLHLQEKNWVQAIAMAKKSNVLAVHDRLLQARNWLIIARARDALGDSAGSQQAMDMARKLQK